MIVQESSFIANKRNLVECFNFLINFNQRMIESLVLIVSWKIFYLF